MKYRMYCLFNSGKNISNSIQYQQKDTKSFLGNGKKTYIRIHPTFFVPMTCFNICQLSFFPIFYPQKKKEEGIEKKCSAITRIQMKQFRSGYKKIWTVQVA
jgi:hypothetical protein